MPLTRSKSLPSTDAATENGGSDRQNLPSTGRSVAGILHKWTNYGKGWRSRWFLLRDGILSYSKIRRPENVNMLSPSDDVRLIGDNSTDRLSRMYSCSGRGGGRRKHHKTIGIVHLKVSSYRESKSDNKKFYIFTATKTLHLRTDSRSDRAAWLQALASTRRVLPLQSLSGDFSFVSPKDLSISTERLKERLREEGINENLVKECEEIVDSEFSEVQEQIKLLHEERTKLLNALKQLEMANLEAEASGIHESVYQLPDNKYSSLRSGKYSECSTSASSDVFEDISEEDEPSFHDTNECFSEPDVGSGDMHFKRRIRLPDPAEKEKGVSLWSMIKDNVGKDLSRVCLPVYFNEPISSLQKCFEDLEYSYLLDQAYEYGKSGNSLLRALYVAAFAVSGYASTEGRHCKPFNPLLGETYEADFPEKGIRFFSEKVSHHPTVIACHCEGKGWKFSGDTNLRSKFWGRSIQLEPVGVLTLEFDDGETFQWSKVTTTIYNILLGKLYCDHHGTMQIRGNRQYSCTLKFKEQSILDRNPHQVNGVVEDVTGKKAATVFGKWNDSLHYVAGDALNKASASLLWKSTKPPPNVTRYNLTSFAITLNELTPGLEEKLPPTDSRLRPDQRHLEKGEYEKANEEKQRLERRQRMSRKIQESGWRPRWFEQQGESESYKFTGGYWEAREERRWDDCPNIFGEFTEEITDCA
ncbi:Oxysterol-binding protein-related protein 2B [Raphanus sativus]|uniref:Oxysterol-binding protein-related protein 2B isoform X2 n=1 Tax=Raphanus sativus TaxID=3726 RepID=A0A6J0MXN3_RAPSA|nr:oxysterol-binding protein-related protein 2B isoform X2 [Raphanus sativus]XP_056862093.1 oxysterol-binding protein-related protein 2B isoform X2 [Raphanus sativus]KAJ4868137.1 Oxysterol-binding protein-related protein 2B [Raphanus sativus]KAJ4905763.1 Oxysterol-binding protein-related protein 2B [Raphanus sativus]